MLKRLVKRAAITGGLELSALFAQAGLMAKARGVGAIFTLHHVRPLVPRHVDPNGHLEITPEFLDAAILRLKADGYRFVRLEEVPGLLAAGDDARPFAAFTLDDGYRDNRDFALPVFERHGVPFTIFICKGFSERSHTLWWATAEALANGTGRLEIDMPDGPVLLPLATNPQRIRAFDAICDLVESGDEAASIARLDKSAHAAGLETRSIPEKEVMTAAELADLCRHPLVSLGAHTVSHRALALIEPAELSDELSQSAAYVEAITGKRPATFAYPYGDRRSVSPETVAAVARAGFALAVTTKPGTLSARHADALAQLPRISLNGYYQKPRYVSALASGIPFQLKQR